MKKFVAAALLGAAFGGVGFAQELPVVNLQEESVPYHLEVAAQGAMHVKIGQADYLVESMFSEPVKAGWCRFLGEEAPNQFAEVAVKKDGEGKYVISARHACYTIARKIECMANVIDVRDEIVNVSAEDLGLMVRNHVNVQKSGMGTLTEAWLGGARGDPATARVSSGMSNPTVVVGNADSGLGFYAADDVYALHAQGYCNPSFAGIADNTLAIPKGKSYAMHWQIYPLKRADYFEVVNRIRVRFNRNWTCLGTFAFMSPNWYGSAAQQVNHESDEKVKEFIEARGAKIVSTTGSVIYRDRQMYTIGYGPGILLYPQYLDECKAMVEKIHRATPGVQVIVYTHTNIYNEPDGPEKYKDAIATDAQGQQILDTSYDHYFCPEVKAKGASTRYFFFTLANSLFPDIVKVHEAILGRAGADGIYWDEISGGAGDVTYSQWDGYTARIDPNTKKIVTKYGVVRLLERDGILQLVKRIRGGGKLLVFNGDPGLAGVADFQCQSFTENNTTAVDLAGCARTHLVTPISLGSIGAYTPEDTLKDIRSKLLGGNLYYYYNGTIPYPTITSRMYPLTPIRIGEGFVLGKERLVTAVSGLFEWPGRADARIYYYDKAARETNSDPIANFKQPDGHIKVLVPEGGMCAVE